MDYQLLIHLTVKEPVKWCPRTVFKSLMLLSYQRTSRLTNPTGVGWSEEKEDSQKIFWLFTGSKVVNASPNHFHCTTEQLSLQFLEKVWCREGWIQIYGNFVSNYVESLLETLTTHVVTFKIFNRCKI